MIALQAVIGALGGVRAAVFAGLCALLLAAVGVQSWRLDSAQDDLAAEQLKVAQATAVAAIAARDAESDARAQERRHTEEFAALSGRLVQENEDAHAEVDRLLAGLRDGTQRLRARFQCPTAPGVPGAPAGAGGSDAAADAGLRGADAEFLVRESERADDVVRQLTTCQALLQAERTRKPQPAGG